MCTGLGSAASSTHRDIYKAARTCLQDRAATVRAAAASCLLALAAHAAFVTTTELESVAVTCFRAFEGATYEARKAIAWGLGNVVAMTQQVRSCFA